MSEDVSNHVNYYGDHDLYGDCYFNGYQHDDCDYYTYDDDNKLYDLYPDIGPDEI